MPECNLKKSGVSKSRRESQLLLRKSVLATIFTLPSLGYAVDFGPFTLTGFAKVENTQVSDYCKDCQLYPNEDKQRIWADELLVGKKYGSGNFTVTLFQPFLAANFDLGGGFKASGLLSQRLRDGSEDIPNSLYERNVAISHEDYGSLRLGDMTTRAWSIADYPFGTDIGLADAWGSSGAGYGIVPLRSLRYTSRPMNIFDGDLVAEVTYSQGNTDFKINKPSFWEVYAKYEKNDLTLDFVFQDTRNGNPQAWGHGPFTSLTPFPQDDAKLGSSGQSIAMLMARYKYDSKLDLYAGVRRNRWSGAHAVLTTLGVNGAPDQWNNMFNVDWGGTLNGIKNPGYSVTSTDFVVGAKYKLENKWTSNVGLAYLGKGKTSNPFTNSQNPSERGQRNSATIGTLGLQYDYGSGIQFYGFVGGVRYGRLGLSPVSMPSNSAFTNIDSRVNRTGYWGGIGAVYTF